MKTKLNFRVSRAGYSLVEVAVASTILMIGVGAACVLSLTMITQEEAHVRVSRAVNVMENASRLYQLGIESEVPTGSAEATVFSLLPPDPMIKTFTATAQSTTAMANIGAPQQVSFSMEFYPTSDPTTYSAPASGAPGTWGGRPDPTITGQSDIRTMGPVKVMRHSFR